MLESDAPEHLWYESAEQAGSSGVVREIDRRVSARKQTFRYRATAPGETTIKLEQRRPLETAATTRPQRTISYPVRVK